MMSELANKEILLLVESLSNERGVDRDMVFEAVESALATVAAAWYREEHHIEYEDDLRLRVALDRKSGHYDVFRCWEVIDAEDLEWDGREVTLEQAHETDPELGLGDVIEEKVEMETGGIGAFGRISAQKAKQVIVQKVREAERDKIIERYSKRVGELVIGLVKRVTREHIILDMGDNAEALVLREELMPRDAFRINDRLRGYLYGVLEERRGPQLLVSRTHPQFLVELFKIEVPEIGEEVIEIRAAARDPGVRAKIAVKTNDGRIDPVGACVGMRGARVQAVSNELGGERIDIVLWDDNPAQLAINAMAPAEVSSIMVDEDTRTMDIVVADEQLSQAIGRSGQNVRLASELTGWTFNVMGEGDAAAKHEAETQDVKTLFMEKLDVDENIADVLIGEGFASIDELAYVPLDELANVDGFDEEIAEELQTRASDVLLTQEISGESDAKPADDLLSVDGMTAALAKELAAKGIVTRDDLADQSVDELNDVVTLTDEQAAKLIMAARAHWFEGAE